MQHHRLHIPRPILSHHSRDTKFLQLSYIRLKGLGAGVDSIQDAGPSAKDWLLDQNVSLGAGVAGMLLLLVNRLTVPLETVSDVQSRSDIISLIACSALLLNVLSEQEIVTKERESVALVGYALTAPIVQQSLSMQAQDASKWLINSILSSCPVSSVHILHGNQIVGAGGVVAFDDEKLPALDLGANSIISKALTKTEEIYLPDLQVDFMFNLFYIKLSFSKLKLF